MSSITDAAQASPAWAAVRSIGILERARRATESHIRLGVADQRLMWMFADGEARTLRMIAEELALEQSTVNRQVNAALQSGLIHRFREAGQSPWQFLPTDSGLERFEKELDRHIGLIGTALDTLPPSRRKQFLRDFETFARAYDEEVAASQ